MEMSPEEIVMRLQAIIKTFSEEDTRNILRKDIIALRLAIGYII